MKQINITRDSNGVHFDEVSIDVTETVFFTNLDSVNPHFPEISANELGRAPSPNSSQCIVPPPPPNKFTYKCTLHPDEQGTINVFPVLAAGTTALANATKGQPITSQQVVKGGMSPYTISGQLFQVTDSNNAVIDSGSGIGPGLELKPQTDNTGILVAGTPTLSGTYNFTFTVDDAMGRNLQQVQYSMKVA
jgi:hypothetical protein